MKPNYFYLTLTLIFSISLATKGQVAERIVKEEYKANEATMLNIDSKFGKVEILNWEKSVVQVEVIMKAESDNKEFANETLQKLNVELSQEGNEIFIKTLIEERITSNFRKKVKFSVDITVYTPEWINIKLLNKYGSVFIERIDGKADLIVQYGSLTIRELGRSNVKPLNQISLAYSKGTIEKASWLKTDLSYSKLTIDEAQAIICISKYSSLSSEKINSLVSDAKYDTYSVSSLNNFVGEMKYSNLKVSEFSGKMEIKSSYTSVKVDEVMPGFESLDIDNSRGGYKFGISNKASFNLDGEAIRGDIDVEGMEDLNRKAVNADKTVWGTFGNESTKGDIKIITREGSVKIEIL